MKIVKLLILVLVWLWAGAVFAEKADVESNKELALKEITVYRSPTCSCCEKWLVHLKENNFKVNDNVVDDVDSIKVKYGVPPEMASCHTALFDGYIVEGHVPAADIRRMLKTKPSILGISVPGMPAGTPGMEMGGKKDAYNLYSFDDNRQFKVFNSYPGN